MTVLGGPIPETGARDRRWRERLARWEFDPARQLVLPVESRRRATLAARLRASILVRTYRGHYYGDVFDYSRSAECIREGAEELIFWGGTQSVERLRDWIARSYEPTDDEIERLDVGTATWLNEERGFGPNRPELCKGGTVSHEVFAAPAAIAAAFASFDTRADVHTYVSSVRNCRSRGELVGGVGNHRLNVHELGTSFWGIALWYVFEGGLEMSDYRELYRDPSAVRAALAAGPPLVLAGEDDARFVADLLELNLGGGAARPELVVEDVRRDRSRPRWDAEPSASPELLPYNRVRLVASERGRFESLDDALASPMVRAAASVVAPLPMHDQTSLAAQRALAASGFALALVAPGSLGTGSGPSRPTLGVWSYANNQLPIVAPYYESARSLSPLERRIADAIAARHAHWAS